VRRVKASRIDVVIYTRAGCHLCDDAKRLLEKYRQTYGLTVTEIDIDRDATFKAQFDLCVPVVEINGKVRFRGTVNDVLLRRQLGAER
jgi:glutaredoxin